MLMPPPEFTSNVLAPLDIVKLVGFAAGAALHLYLGWMLYERYGLRRAQRVLLGLGVVLSLWHLGNFAVTIYELLQMEMAGWWRKSANLVAYGALAFLPPLLAHAHFKMLEWFDPAFGTPARRRWLRWFTWLGYLPLATLPYVFTQLWREPYEPPIERLGLLLLPFMLWFVFIFLECAGVDWRLASIWEAPREKQFFKTFALTMLASAALFGLTYVLGARQWAGVGRSLDLFARLSSIIPTAIVAYYIYRYRYFELVFRQSLLYAVFAAIVMMTYIYGIRRLSLALESRYQVRPDVIEALLIIVLIALAEPLRRVVERTLRQLFTREVGLYRELVTQVGEASARLGNLNHFLAFAEQHLCESLALQAVRLIPTQQAQGAEAELCRLAEARQFTQIEGAPLLEQLAAVACYALWREGRVVGLLIIRDTEQALTAEKREVLTVLSGHLAVAIENCQLLETNVKLERELAASERMATLGQMAATVAHEVKNPLSAIKSITQVMREDADVSREYGRDLDLIAGEVDRLSRSVSQLLNFARPAAIAAAPATLQEVFDATLRLTSAEAAARQVTVTCSAAEQEQLNGETVAALKEILLNLLLNALQASVAAGTIQLVGAVAPLGQLEITVTDTGTGIPAEVQGKIFTPFFTTKQRGTGLGLAIVARRVRELGGTIACVSPVANGQGTRFTVRLPR